MSRHETTTRVPGWSPGDLAAWPDGSATPDELWVLDGHPEVTASVAGEDVPHDLGAAAYVDRQVEAAGVTARVIDRGAPRPGVAAVTLATMVRRRHVTSELYVRSTAGRSEVLVLTCPTSSLPDARGALDRMASAVLDRWTTA